MNLRLWIFAPVLLLMFGAACKRTFNESSNVLHAGELKFNKTGPWRFEYSSPFGHKLFKEAIEWIDDQPSHRAQPANCAFNVSDVFENAGFDGNVYRTYSSPLVLGMFEKVEAKGGKLIRFSTKNKSDFIRIVNEQLGGKIPLGTLFGGCENRTCDGDAGSGHIAMVGDVDADGYLQLYHNNWYRPDNEGGQWRPHMISKFHYNHGLPRQWMPTPWLKIIRNDPSNPDLITDVVSAYQLRIHGIDDLDPFTYFSFIGVVREMWDEIKAGKLVKGEVLTATQIGLKVTPNAACTAQNADARIISESEISVRLSSGKSSKARPFEPVCFRKKEGTEVFVFFPLPPAGNAYVPQDFVKKCDVARLNACIEAGQGEGPCAKKECTAEF